uniref:Craniofacial development protein 1 n=1 Tax=Strongyloides papillosus TaxID=174720 RepID=A0A0N5C705_STREA
MDKEFVDDNNCEDEEDVDYTPESDPEEDVSDKEEDFDEDLKIEKLKNTSEENEEEKKVDSGSEDDDEIYNQLLNAGNTKCKVTTKISENTTESKNKSTKEDSIPTNKRSAKSSGLLDIAESMKKRKTTSISQCTESWKKYVTSTGISEELASFNKGKGGFLARQDFLAKTDLRQFEKEKDARNALRKTKQ